MDRLILQNCSDEHLELLAQMNKQLIEDEQHDNPMNLLQLKERMKNFLHTDYAAYLFKENDEVKGYALIHMQSEPLYIRHFFICRDCRRQGYGKRAFEKLTDAFGTRKLEIDVMHGNEAGYRFWKSLGFKERSITMRLEHSP